MWLVEARTVFGRTRIRALLGVLVAVPVFLALAVYLSGDRTTGTGRRLSTGSRKTAYLRLWRH